MDPYLFKRLWRRPWLSLCSLVLSAVLCLLMGILSGYRENQQEKLDQTRAEYDILCVASDRRGTRTNSLKMDEDVLNLLFDESEEGLAPHMRELRITKEFEYVCYAQGLFDQLDLTLVGVNCEQCAAELDPALGGEVTYLTENFYDQDEFLCLVSRSLFDDLTSDTLPLDVEDPFISARIREYVGSGSVELKVAGYYEGSGNIIYISFDAAMRLADAISRTRSCDTVSFYAADNDNLDAIYAVAKRYFGTVNPNAPVDAVPHVALTIHDEQYRATVTALEQNIARTGYLLPIISLLGLGVGFLISFLFTRSERRTYALMRTLGMTRGRLFGSILREQLVLVALAAGAALALTREPGPTVFYFVSYSIGCAVCIIKAIRVPPTAILRDQE